MKGMFENATVFNQSVNFTTEKVENMTSMFAYAEKFNKPVNFDTQNVKNMALMFFHAKSFNQPVTFTTMKNVTDSNSREYMSDLFGGAELFDENNFIITNP